MNKFFSFIVLLGVVFGLISISTAAEAAKTKPKPARVVTYCPAQWGAHQGEGTPTPNSRDSSQAMEAAIADPQAAFVESDVWATADGQGLMQHSNSLSEASTGTGNVSDHTMLEIKTTMRMKDGTVPQSLPEWIQQMVSAKKHALLHDKAASLNAYIVAALKAVPNSHMYIRIMVASYASVDYFKANGGWYTEMGVTRVATAAIVAQAVKYNEIVMVTPFEMSTAVPENWIKPFLDAGVTTDFVSYSPTQDAQIKDYDFNRVLTGDISESSRISGCP